MQHHVPTKVVVHYQLRSFAGDRVITAHYDIVGTAFRIPTLNERLRKGGRWYKITRVTWDLDSSPMSQEVVIVAEEMNG
ncbi:hypothetical protein SEA_OUTIS_60 [Gordonia phage Outis]|nr:hypothetical protein SEA_STARSTRUCK_60 [Gordonia phage StarStruck]WGH22067.1 hypothetical protein [Gordonia phage MerCougar]WKW85033.1 hypothetical protein SEA_OUTIS_60 [Gordonia phage Outis]